MEFHNYTTHQSDWISFLLMGVVLVYGVLFFTESFQYKSTVGLLFSKDGSGKEIGFFSSVLLTLNTLVVFGLFVYLAFAYFQLALIPGPLFFLRIVFGVLVLIGIQRIVIYLHSWVTNTVDFFKKTLSLQNQFAHLAAISSLPLLILSLYSTQLNKQLIIAGATVFGGIYFIGIVKSIVSSNRIKGSLKFHLIFYLCGNEILPFFLFYKVLI